jgi:hypothetical protein
VPEICTSARRQCTGFDFIRVEHAAVDNPHDASSLSPRTLIDMPEFASSGTIASKSIAGFF